MRYSKVRYRQGASHIAHHPKPAGDQQPRPYLPNTTVVCSCATAITLCESTKRNTTCPLHRLASQCVRAAVVSPWRQTRTCCLQDNPSLAIPVSVYACVGRSMVSFTFLFVACENVHGSLTEGILYTDPGNAACCRLTMANHLFVGVNSGVAMTAS